MSKIIETDIFCDLICYSIESVQHQVTQILQHNNVPAHYTTYRRLGAKGSYLTLVRVADGIL